MIGLVTLALSYILSQFYRSFLAVLTPVLSSDLAMTNQQFSVASGIWFVTFALMQFVVGYSLDRFGPRRTAAVILAVGGGGGAALFAVATSPAMVIAAMALIGIGCSPLLMASLFIFARTYPPVRFAVLTSGFIAIGNLGNVLGAAPLAALVAVLGWRASVGLFAVFTVAIALAVYLVVRDPPRAEADQASSGFAGFIDLMRIPVLWAIITLVAVNYAPAAGIRGLWAGPYLADVFALSPLTIGNVTFFMAIAMVIGSFAYGPMDTLFKTRKWVAFGGNAVSAAALLTLALLPLPAFWTATILLMVIGVFGMSFGVLMAHARSFVPAHLTGRHLDEFLLDRQRRHHPVRHRRDICRDP
jgi:predicted MFS family arabinose efflux permease